MLHYLFRFLGVTPDQPGKSGKRESAWTIVLIALALTVASMWAGVEMVQAMTALLMAIWGSGIVALGGAYKLEHDKGIWKGNVMGEPVPPGWPQDIAAPERGEDP